MELQKIKAILVHEMVQETGEVKEKRMLVPIPTVRSHYNSRFYPKHEEINDQPSQTIPDQTMTVSEIVKRFASGLPLTGAKVPLYEEEGDMPDISKLDLAERQEIIEAAQEEIREITARVNKRKEEAQNARLEAKIKSRVEERENKRKQYEELQKQFANDKLPE